MSFLNPEAESKIAEDAVASQIKSMFPFEGRSHDLILKNIEVGSTSDIHDLAGQKNAKLQGKTWATPIYGDLELQDKTGKVLDSVKRMKISSVPSLTQRFSYIVNGAESQVSHLWRLKSGVYSLVKDDGTLQSQFNLEQGRGFSVLFSPKSRKFDIKYGTSTIPLGPVLKTLGLSTDDISKRLGSDITEANLKTTEAREIPRLYKLMFGKVAPNLDDAKEGVRARFADTLMKPEVNEMNLGHPFTEVNGSSLLASARKLLQISRGAEKPDQRDSLQYKELWGLSDFLPERVKHSERAIGRKIKNNLDRKRSIREILPNDLFYMPIRSFFSTAMAEQPHQTNPIDMVAGQRRTTVLSPPGLGGISSEHSVGLQTKLVDESHLGFIDPIPTPEGARTGITTFLPLGASKNGLVAQTKAWSTKEKKMVALDPVTASKSVIAFPDQYTWDKGNPRPVDGLVKVVNKENKLTQVSPTEVDYVLPSSRGLFTISTNLIPFMQNDQGNRTNYATKQMSQAISLRHREAPLVQVGAGGSDKDMTWEKIMGGLFSHHAPVAGVISAIGKDSLKIKSSDGKIHTVPLYRNYPLNDGKSFIDATTVVKKGDKVKKGDLLADTNFTENGTMALGVNGRVAYLPMRELTFEDGIVISESFATKLSSEHMYQDGITLSRNHILDRKKFRAYYADRMTDVQAKKLDDEGVVMVGQRVEAGDTLIAALKKSESSKEQLLLHGIHRTLVRPFADASIKWDHDGPGVVTEVVRHGTKVQVHVRTVEAAQAGDKLTDRHGGKGVISRILPNEEMPQDKDGEAIDIVLNPVGVVARMNPGQVLETSLGKVAKARGTTYAVTNFEPDAKRRIVEVSGHWRSLDREHVGKDESGNPTPGRTWVKKYERDGYQDLVLRELDAHGILEREILYDPKTGDPLHAPGAKEGVMVGHKYFLKLEHMSKKKLSARSQGAGMEYTSDMSPKGGGQSGGQSMGSLGILAMLAHGSVTANLREMMTIKSDREQDEFWTALQSGEPLPPPKAPFAFEKFVGYLNALGVNVEKEGHSLYLGPMTDKETLKLSNGEITDPEKVIRGKDLKPEKGGLFDEDITGGMNGSGWGHVVLPEPFPNPIFEKAIRSLVGLKVAEFNDIMSGKKGIDEGGTLVPAEEAEYHAGYAIKKLLSKIDVKKDLASAESELKLASKSRLDALNKKVKYLRALDKLDMSADDAYIRQVLPVIPPRFRPMSVLDSGDLNISDLNGIYKELGVDLLQLKTFDKDLPPEFANPVRAEVYDGMRALAGLSGQKNNDLKGVLDLISGTSPKYGYFQKKLLYRKQDMSMRGVISPSEDLHLDEVGIPKEAAMSMFKPFVIRDMVRIGYTPLEARKEVEEKSKAAQVSLDNVIKERPVLMKRDPALHKFSVMAFRPVLIPGHTIRIHSLVTGGFNADFDGDTTSLYVPVTEEARREALGMFPSQNLFNTATGAAMYKPGLEGTIGLYLLTRFGKETQKSFKTKNDALMAAKERKIPYDGIVSIGGKKTTAGRLLFHSLLPVGMYDEDFLTNPAKALSDKNVSGFMQKLATDYPQQFPEIIGKVKEVAWRHVYQTGMTITSQDLKPLISIRENVLDKARVTVNAAKKAGKRGDALDQVIISAYTKARMELKTRVSKAIVGSDIDMYKMVEAGLGKPGWSQLQQTVLAPILLTDAHGKTIPLPVTKSYAEGLDVSEYWTTTHGARKGILDKTQEVSAPGALNKQISNVVMDLVVTSEDCGTDKGIHLDATSRDALDRFTAISIKTGKGVMPAGTLITPKVSATLKAAKVKKVLVRSPLRCKQGVGLCAKCFGVVNGGRLPKLRTNIGMLAGQSVGERSVQLAMKTFHSGGVAGGKGSLTGFDRLKQILNVPENLPGSATLSQLDGSVSSVSKDPAGGWRVSIGGDDHYVPQDRGLKISTGSAVKKGQAISGGVINPKELLDLTNIATVQNYLTKSIEETYAGEGLKRRNYEVLVKAMTNLSSVLDSGDHPEFIRGDTVSTSLVADWNRKNKDKKPLRMEPILKGITTLPLEGNTDWAARMNYRDLKNTLSEGAMRGWGTNLHGANPIPGLMYAAEMGRPPVDMPWAY